MSSAISRIFAAKARSSERMALGASMACPRKRSTVSSISLLMSAGIGSPPHIYRANHFRGLHGHLESPTSQNLLHGAQRTRYGDGKAVRFDGGHERRKMTKAGISRNDKRDIDFSTLSPEVRVALEMLLEFPPIGRMMDIDQALLDLGMQVSGHRVSPPTLEVRPALEELGPEPQIQASAQSHRRPWK